MKLSWRTAVSCGAGVAIGGVAGFFAALWIGDRITSTEMAAYYGLMTAFVTVPVGAVLGGWAAYRIVRRPG